MHCYEKGLTYSVNYSMSWFGKQPLHASHAFFFHAESQAWICSRCGSMAKSKTSSVASPCKGSPSVHGRQILARLACSLFPCGESGLDLFQVWLNGKEEGQ